MTVYSECGKTDETQSCQMTSLEETHKNKMGEREQSLFTNTLSTTCVLEKTIAKRSECKDPANALANQLN